MPNIKTYRTMPNIKRIIARHNNKVLQEHIVAQNPEMRVEPYCNCPAADKPNCPMPGACYQPNVVYIAEVTSVDDDNEENKEFYTGCSVNFKTRFNGHKSSFTNPKAKQTTLSTHVRSLRSANTPHNIKWSIKDRGPPYNPSTGKCRLCLLEKYYIMFEPERATLNKRTEIFSHCFHKDPQLLGRGSIKKRKKVREFSLTPGRPPPSPLGVREIQK